MSSEQVRLYWLEVGTLPLLFFVSALRKRTSPVYYRHLDAQTKRNRLDFGRSSRYLWSAFYGNT